MKFPILLIGISIFFLCLFLHISVWRLGRPRRRVVVLFLLFILLPLFAIIGYMGLEWLGFLQPVIPFTPAEWLAIYLFHLAFSSAYILSYPAIEAVSPSLAILSMIGDSGPHGLLHGYLLHVFDDEIVLEPRIQDLIEAGLIVESDGYLRMAPRGIAFVKCFILLRQLLGLPIGKG